MGLWIEQVLLDGIADEEDAAESQGQAAHPDGPAGAEPLLETLARRSGLGRSGGDRRNEGGLWGVRLLLERGGFCQGGLRSGRRSLLGSHILRLGRHAHFCFEPIQAQLDAL